MKSDLVDIAVEIHHETEKAWLVSDDGHKENAKWVPKSQAEIETKGRSHTLTCPEWLAVEKGFL